MLKVAIPLRHILLDPNRPDDLNGRPVEEAVRLIKESYGFLATAIDVRLEGEIAVISLEEPQAAKVSDALKLYERGVKSAQRGDYPKAISQFKRVLETIPTHVDARRNLAMAHMERGNSEIAKEVLRECLRLDPKDGWSFVLLGNIAAKNDRNLDAAAFYYESGLAINPKDHLLLNNFAALRMQQGRFPEARVLFERALESDPLYPNTYFGLALLHRTMGAPDAAASILERFFALPRAEDLRSTPVYRNASGLYAELAEELAARDGERLFATVIARAGELEAATGHPVEIIEDGSLGYVSGIAQMAWAHGRDEHRIRYRRISPATLPHLIAHEMEHIVLEHEARRQGKNRTFVSTSGNRENALRGIAGHIAKLRGQGYPKSEVEQLMSKLVHGLTNQLFNCPIDMVVEHNLRRKFPELRHSQLVSLRRQNDNVLKMCTDPEIRKITPPPLIFHASVALNCAYALFIDHLFPGAPSCAGAFQTSEDLTTGRELFGLWEERIRTFRPGDGYPLVEAFAEKLKLSGWFEWRKDVRTPSPDAMAIPAGPTHLVGADQPDAYRFCLDALCRFEGKSRDEVFAVASEIGLLGMRGIDPNAPGKKYSVASYPGETFSGLHLLCLMYVGFRVFDPSVNTGLDFSSAYDMALEAHKAVKH